MRSIARAALLFGAVASLAFAGLSLRGGPVEAQAFPYLPRPVDQIPGEGGEPEFSRRRQAWMASMRLAAPGVDTEALDAAYRSERDRRFQAQRKASTGTDGKPVDLMRFSASAVSGTWNERGSSNQAGRVLTATFDSAQQRLTVLSHGGNVWRADRSSLNWRSSNDAATFLPAGTQGFLLRLAGSAGERLLVLGDQPAQVRYSDDGGFTFSTPGGSSLANPWYATGLAARDVAGSEVYYARVHYDSTAPAAWRTHLFASVDRGASFTPVAFVGEPDQAALFSPRYGDARMFLLSGTQLSTITAGTHARLPVSTVPHALSSGETISLSGGVTTEGQTFLFAFYSNARDSLTRVYYSANAGASWTARTPAPTSMLSLNSAASSVRDPNRVFVGGVDLFRSADGGAGWTRVNPWGEYYASPATKLHADICGIDVFLDASNVERVFVSTDGGLYESTDQLLSVQNLALSGLNVSQYYGSYTLRQAPFHIVAGAQDQGYQKALSPAAGPQPFVQTISGDYAHLVSADGGATTWSVFPTFAMVETTAGAANQNGLRYYLFGSAQLRGTLFLPPLAALPGEPNKVLLAGGRFGVGTAHNLIELRLAGTVINGEADPFNFQDPITAIAVSPHAGETRYALVAPASGSNPGARFYRRSAGTWTQTVSQLPNGQNFYGARILPDPARAGHVYVAGSGYGAGNGNAVYLSTNDGLSFTPMSTGLPPTLVLGLAISADGQHLFAAAETGAYYYDRAQQRWIDIVTAGAPNQIYWHVDYIDELRTARFSTYGRGIWDFALDSGANHVVTVGGSGNSFSPSTLRIQAGDTVTFRNLGGFHNVVADNNSFRCSSSCASAANPNGGDPDSSQWSQTIAFNTAGDFGYYCSAHGGPGGIGMAGTIKVEGSGPAFSIGSAVSGNWFTPAQSGHGFQLEKVNDTTVTAFWFTFDANGNQAWILGVGQIVDNRIEMQAVKSRGGRFPPNFDPTQITNLPWGRLTFTFTGCNAGSVVWTSTDPAFTASGTLALQRVTSVQGTTCQ